MAPRADEDNFSASDDDESDDEGLKEDLAALSRAFDMSGGDSTAPPAAASTDLVVRTDSDDELRDDPLLATGDAIVSVDAGDSGGYESNEDIEYLQRLQSLYKPLATLPPSPSPPPRRVDVFDDEDDDDVETVRAIFKRFADYDMRGFGTMTEGDQASSPGPERDIVNGSTSSIIEGGETCPIYQDNTNSTDLMTGNTEMQHSGLAESSNPDGSTLSRLPRRRSSFPPLAQALFDALKKNRSLQKFIRSKMIEVEAKIEENKRLRNNVKILKDFQSSCLRRTGSALSLKKDPRVPLISAQKRDSKRKSPMCFGPPENPHVANYKMVLERFPRSLDRKKWSNEEKENLMKGIKQQIQEDMLREITSSKFSHGDGNYMDSIMESINQFDITPEIMKEYKVDWDKLASTHVPGRTGAECESRWLNCEDPLINHGPWTSEEDRFLLLLIQQMGIRNWFNIAESLGTKRTPFQCLARFQRSLNPSMLNREWTKEEDAQLCSAVAIYGESNWQAVASVLERRTGTQCSNRWKKSLFPERKGSFTQEEDKRLTVAVMLFGRKWNQIARFVPGRTQCQCRDRYVNSLDPSLKWGGWTEEEDSRLQDAIAKHGFCWSKVAEDMPPRTDSQCRKRFKVLFPDQAYMLQEARKKQKSLVAGNFVDRESERPNLTLNDFLPLPTLGPLPSGAADDDVDENLPRKRKRKSSNEAKISNGDVNIPKRRRSQKHSRNTLVNAKQAEDTVHDAKVKACSGKLSRSMKGAETSKKKRKNKMLKRESLSTGAECSGSDVEDNITLSSFVHKKLNKRGLKCNKNDSRVSTFATEVVSKQVNNQSPSAEQDGSSQSCCAVGVEHLVMEQNVTSDRLLTKPENVNRLAGDDDDDNKITLACFMGNKSKKCKVTRGPCTLSSSKSKGASVSVPEVDCTEKAINAEEEDELLATFLQNKSKGVRRKVKRKEGNC